VTDLDEAQQVSLRRYVEVVRRRKLTVVLVAVGMATAATLTSLAQDRVYQSSAQVLVQPRTTESVFSDSGLRPSTGTVETEVQVLKSDPVRSGVRERLGSIPDVSARRLGETDVMEIRASSGSPSRAAAVANAYANAYADFRKTQAVGDLLAASQGIQQKIRDLDVEIKALDSQISAAPPADRSSVETTLRPRLTNLITQQGLLAQKLDELQVDATLKTGGAQVVKVAQVPAGPVSPKPIRTGVLALATGLILGAGLALVREHLDESIRTKEELDRAVPTPVLGVIPLTDGWEEAGAIQRSLNQPGPTAEAFRGLRTSVQLLGVNRPIRTLSVTSAAPAEGKSSVVAGLGVVLATAGQRVVMVDCDLRRPRLHSIFDVPNDVGFTSVLLGDVDARDAIRQVRGEAQLYVLTSGGLPANPSEVLASRDTSKLLFELQEQFDMVIVDTPPVLPVTDATVVATWVEATLLVARAGTTTKRQLTDALEQLQRAEARVMGTVLNHAAREATRRYDYGYYQQPSNGNGAGRHRKRPAGSVGSVPTGRSRMRRDG
jgi:capsular exopolysaccharide synthesis family protein